MWATTHYLQTQRSLTLENQGGARARVNGIDLISSDTRRLGRDAFQSRAVWDVTGSVGHWGHVHQRVNRYEADLIVERVDGAWRITGLDVLQEERIVDPTAAAAGAP